jgi:nucleoside-diphosphate-sugar epimerase
VVTGAGGFIGSHLVVDQLRRGYSVVALDLDLGKIEQFNETGRVKCIEADVADPVVQRQAAEDADVVFHLAAAHLGANIPEAEYRRVNVEAARTLAETCLQAGVRRLVHCSSVGVFGRLVKTPANEASECRPELPYEKTKLEGERVLLDAHGSSGLPVTILRPVWVYGPGCPRTEKIEALNLAAESERAVGQVVIVGDAGAVEIRQLVAEISSLTHGRRPPSVPLPVLYGAGLVAEKLFGALGREAPLSRRSLRFFTGNTSFEIDRAREVLGYTPRFTLSNGLRETNDLLERGEFWRLPLPDPAGS